MIIASDRKLPRVDLPIPSGWFQVLYSNELEVGQAKPLEYFDQELVAFRTESGQAKVVDAYCPHMGAHLGYGIRDQAGHGSAVVGESIVCPFHGWAYDGEGKCKICGEHHPITINYLIGQDNNCELKQERNKK